MKDFAKKHRLALIIAGICVFAVIIWIVLAKTVCAPKSPPVVESVMTDGEVKVGDTVNYTFYMKDCGVINGVTGMLFFDDEYVECDYSSVKFPKLYNVVNNWQDDKEDRGNLYFAFYKLNDDVDFTEKGVLVSADFKVKKLKNGGMATIKYFIIEMTDANDDPVKSFVFTCDYSVNGKKQIENAEPTLLYDKNRLDEHKYQAQFINYSDGKGEKNGSGENHFPVTGETRPQEIEVSKGNSYNGKILWGGLALVFAAIVVVAAVKRKSKSKSKK